MCGHLTASFYYLINNFRVCTTKYSNNAKKALKPIQSNIYREKYILNR